MSVMIDLPHQAEIAIKSNSHDALERSAKEALAIKLYSDVEISLGKLASMLGMGVIEADDWLAERGVMIPMTIEDLKYELSHLPTPRPE